MRIALACGGTGGHFYPGYVLGQALRGRGHEVLFVLRAGDPAGPRLAEEDLPFTELDLGGMPRRLWAAWPAFAWRLAGSLCVARNLIKDWRPSAAVGMGGYLTFPLAAAAWWCGVPYVLHESNSVVGLANRVCRAGARALALGLPVASPPPNAVLTGTPVRPEILRPADAAAARAGLGLDPRRTTLLVFGGSQGAAALNVTVPEGIGLAAGRLPRGTGLQVLHLSGAKDEGACRAAYVRAATRAGAPGLRAVVLPYLSEMHRAYAAADLAVCRAGASTLAELRARRLPALLVPYPHAADSHQEANARLLERAGAARALREPLSAPAVAAALSAALEPAALGGMAAGYAALELPAPGDCAAALADLVERAAGAGEP